MPILDPETSPNGYYNQSPFLFWTIITVGARKYQNDPTLLGAVAPRLIKRYMMPLQSGIGSIQIVEGLLLTSTWPLPCNSLSKDASFALSGLIMHLAMRLGLHIPAYSQDFSRTKLELDDTEIQKRARLWGYCVFTCQRYVGRRLRQCQYLCYHPAFAVLFAMAFTVTKVLIIGSWVMVRD